MLNPNARSLYTAALTPPPGMVFDEAVATTFSLDPAVLLTVPVHLALLGNDARSALKDGIAVLEAVRRLSGRITVYGQRGRLAVPSPPHALYGLLESMVVEVVAPRGGVFHPKVWVLRFVDPARPTAVAMRLMVLSRNLTNDRSWDVSLMLDGRPTVHERPENHALAELVRRLPTLAPGGVPDDRVAQAERLAREVERTEWELPPGYDVVRFNVLGLRAGTWSPERSGRMAVISPFCTDDALRSLAASTGQADALITRPETLAELDPTTRDRFRQLFALDDAAETEDGEEVDPRAVRDTHGLHAKVYLLERGWDVHLVLGSANATNAALLAGANVEVLVELVGKRSRVGGVDKLLGPEGLGEVLVAQPEVAVPADADAERKAAEQALEDARSTLADAGLRVACTPTTDDAWSMELVGRLPVRPEQVRIRAWPITVGDDRAVGVGAPGIANGAPLGAFGAASITGLIAFELSVASPALRVRFVLNLPVDGLPEARDTAILQTVVRNRESFLRYLMLLLGDMGFGSPAADDDALGSTGQWTMVGSGGVPLLEELVRTFARDPARLREVGRLVRRLTAGRAADEIVPTDFVEMWRVFEAALERRDG